MIESIGEWQRTHFSSDITPDMDNDTVILMGWVRAIRGGGKLKFIQLADKNGYIQITAKTDDITPELMEKINELNREYVIGVKGTVKRNEQAPGGIEIVPQTIKILNTSEAQLPMEVIQKKTPAELPTRLNTRFMDLRRPEIAAIFKIRDHVTTAIRLFLESHDFIEINTPKLVAQATESGANVFKVTYFDQEAYLAQSPQFYKQTMMAASFDRVYEISPVFRAEKHHTIRHVTEYTSLDFEMSFIRNSEDVATMIEKLMVYIWHYVKTNAKEELKLLDKEINVPKTPFPRISMREAYQLLKEADVPYKEGDDLDTNGEKELGRLIREKFAHEFVFLTEFPWSVRPFYTMKKEDEPEWTASFDMLCNGLEIVTGGQREHRHEILVKQAEEKKIDPKTLSFYMNMFKFGVPPHGGSGIGVDRIVMQMLDLGNIREAVLFPREPDRLTP
ncbi:MAG: aspartate--tRNA(Asn) ligase [Candidatus Aenigmarchaeota archaeon]|nr:aspartate--tRNA(Asn) ligase [Candidatus Aenigmarchaeota archaeon]